MIGITGGVGGCASTYTTSYSNHKYMNVTAEIDEFKSDVGLFLIGSTATIRTPSNDFRPKVSFA